MGDNNNSVYDPCEGTSRDFLPRPADVPGQSRSPSPPPPRILLPPRARDPNDPFVPFRFKSTDLTGFPYTPDFHKAIHDRTLPAVFQSGLPEPHATALREYPKTHPEVAGQPTFNSPTPFKWRQGEPIIKCGNEEREPNRGVEQSNKITSILDKGVLNETSNFVCARLPGFKSVRKYGHYSREPENERPALINMAVELPGDSDEKRQLNSSVLDVMSAGLCTELIVEPRLRPPSIDMNDQVKTKCCRSPKKQENTRSCFSSVLGAGAMRTKYKCGSYNKGNRYQFRSKTNVAKKSKEGDNMVYSFALTFVKPV